MPVAKSEGLTGSEGAEVTPSPAPLEATGIAPVTAADVAKAIGRSASSVYRLVDEGVLPARKEAGRMLFDLDEVLTAWKGRRNMDENPRIAAARRIRERAMAAARETWCFEVPNQHGACVIVAHPGQEPPSDPDVLRREFGLLDPTKVIRLSESWAAPQPLSIEAEVDAARRQLRELEAEMDRRRAIEAEILETAKAKVTELEVEADAKPSKAGSRA